MTPGTRLYAAWKHPVTHEQYRLRLKLVRLSLHYGMSGAKLTAFLKRKYPLMKTELCLLACTLLVFTAPFFI